MNVHADAPLCELQSAVGPHILIEGRRYLNFGGSSYLGLSQVPEIIEAGVAALRSHGPGMPILRSHGLATPFHVAAEEAAAHYFDTEAALFLNTGYHVGLVLLHLAEGAFDTIHYDASSHYSLVDAIRASRSPAFEYQHLDAGRLADELSRNRGRRPLIVTDGVFSSTGEVAPLDQFVRLANVHDGLVLVDEAHSFGVLGPAGRGTVDHFGLASDRILRGGSLGKAFGVAGGIIPGSEEQVKRARNAPAWRGATPGSANMAAAAAASLQIAAREPERLARLRGNIANLKSGLRSLGLGVGSNEVPIASFQLDSGAAMATLKARLLEEGIFVYHTHYAGAGPEGAVRIAIFADHERADLERLLDVLGHIL